MVGEGLELSEVTGITARVSWTVPYLVYVGGLQRPPEPFFRFKTHEEASSWRKRLQMMAARQGIGDATIFVR